MAQQTDTLPFHTVYEYAMQQTIHFQIPICRRNKAFILPCINYDVEWIIRRMARWPGRVRESRYPFFQIICDFCGFVDSGKSQINLHHHNSQAAVDICGSIARNSHEMYPEFDAHSPRVHLFISGGMLGNVQITSCSGPPLGRTQPEDVCRLCKSPRL